MAQADLGTTEQSLLGLSSTTGSASFGLKRLLVKIQVNS